MANNNFLLIIVVFSILSLFLPFTYGRLEFDLYKSTPVAINTRDKRDVQGNPPTNDSVNLFKYMNGEYYGIIGIGSPAKQFKVIFDTSWADIFLPSSHCSLLEVACRLHTQYDSSKSSTFIPNNRPINITDDELSLSGFLSTDTFHLAHLKLPNQTFLEATHMSANPFLLYKADGFIGMGYRSLSQWKDYDPFFYNLLHQKIITEAVFTFYMNRDETTERAGKVILGGRQRKHVKNGTLTTLQVIAKNYWTVQIDSIFAQMNQKNYPIVGKCKGYFDSSSNAMRGPAKLIEQLNFMMGAIFVPKLNKYAVNCRNYAKFPQVHITLNGAEFVMLSKYYVQRMTLDNVEVCFSPFVPDPDPNATVWQLGGAFMMEFYTEFDLDNNVINIGETIF